MVDVAQLVRAADCGSVGRGFEPHLPPKRIFFLKILFYFNIQSLLMNGKLKGNLMMFVAKTFSGLNQNALRYLLPHWMSPQTGVVLRLGFGALFFGIYEIFVRKRFQLPSWKHAFILFGAGLIFVFGYMWALLEGLTYTTPISSSIFISLQPVFVFIICLIIKTEKSTWKKVIGMLLGFGGALLCVLTQHSSVGSS